ncbi:MAG: hypothetical protein B7Z47_00125 [Chthoniobacter sp. 12-60-6]|nr:MAG: hypothetical protein B7Z47_00125 [Chthoniobacter sp. 12-60-6]
MCRDVLMKIYALILSYFVLCGHAIAADVDAFKSRLLAATTKHLNLLLKEDGSVVMLKGKGADGEEALAFYRAFEITGDQRYRKAALSLADRVLHDMREMKFGVLPIKEKEKPGTGAVFIGGGPPALGFYTANVAYILHKEGGRGEDLKYLGRVLDEFPWSKEGWWSADIDVKTGESKQPLTKPSIINKSAAIAMATGMLSEALRDASPELSARLKQKTDKCLYAQIIPAQVEDGFWHYSLSGNDPKDKDILGYFMLTIQELMELQLFNPAYREPRLDAALKKAQSFALKCIAPMTDPNTGKGCDAHTTPSTPKHYALAEEPKRGFQLGIVLIGGGFMDEGIKITDASLTHFDFGNGGMDGVHAVAPTAGILALLRP